MDKKKILVVDDDPYALECVHAILTMHGYDSIPFSDISAALTLLASGASLDLAIIDLMMPEMNGLEFHAKIMKLRPGLPCIMVTGYSSIESYLIAFNNGILEYLNKPYGSMDLKTIVAAALEKTAMRSGGGTGQIVEFGVDKRHGNNSERRGETI
jgi:DNA-binding NtrC family response regulator